MASWSKESAVPFFSSDLNPHRTSKMWIEPFCLFGVLIPYSVIPAVAMVSESKESESRISSLPLWFFVLKLLYACT
jgi:hypothetical protein